MKLLIGIEGILGDFESIPDYNQDILKVAYSNVLPYKKNISSLKKYENKHHISLIAKSNKKTNGLVANWLNKYNLPYRELFFIHESKNINYDYILDTRIHFLNPFNKKGVCMNKEWNKEWNYKRVDSVDEFIEFTENFSEIKKFKLSIESSKINIGN